MKTRRVSNIKPVLRHGSPGGRVTVSWQGVSGTGSSNRSLPLRPTRVHGVGEAHAGDAPFLLWRSVCSRHEPPRRELARLGWRAGGDLIPSGLTNLLGADDQDVLRHSAIHRGCSRPPARPH